MRTNEDVLRAFVIPIGASVVYVYGVVAVLGWWRPVFVDRRPVQRWVLVIPVILLVTVLLAIDYAGLADRTAGFVLLLLLGLLLVGFAEEGMFRGIGVNVLRTNGLTEGRVALWSSVVFGAVHLSNAITAGEAAIVQAIVVSFAGYFFYLTRRATGGLVAGAVLHGLFDFSITSGELGDTVYAGSVAPILMYPVLALLLLRRRHRIEPAVTAT